MVRTNDLQNNFHPYLRQFNSQLILYNDNCVWQSTNEVGTFEYMPKNVAEWVVVVGNTVIWLYLYDYNVVDNRMKNHVFLGIF
jgi:hypothetical protein